MITSKMEAQEGNEHGDDDDDDGGDDFDSKEEPKIDMSDFDVDGDDLDLRLARFQNLLERRKLLINSVLLRQNPHNVEEWLKRITIFEVRAIGSSPKMCLRIALLS